MSQKPSENPTTPSIAYQAMAPKWQKIRTVLAGTDAMRAAGREYLPQHEGETDTAYRERLSRSVLLNQTLLTRERLVGKPFSDPIKVGDDVPAPIKPLLEDIDLEGNNLDVFARHWFSAGLGKAFAHVLVEYPTVDRSELRSLDDDRRDNVRPYWVYIDPEDLLAARTERWGGEEVLMHVRIFERVTEPVGFEEKIIEQVREINMRPVTDTSYRPHVQLWRRTDPNKSNSDWVHVGPETVMEIDRIPLVTFYANRDGLMFGKPPLEDLADKNIEHWQSSSDQRAILTVARFPMLALSGAVDPKGELHVGPNNWLHSPDASSKFYYVEHSGKAIASGRQDLKDLEEQMGQYGADFLRKRPDRETATAATYDEEEATSPLQDMVLRFVDALEQALRFTAHWMGLDFEEAGSVEITGNLEPDSGKPQDLQALLAARAAKDIDRTTYLTELKRRGVLRDDVEIENVEKALEKEEEAALQSEGNRLLLQAEFAPGVADDTEDD